MASKISLKIWIFPVMEKWESDNLADKRQWYGDETELPTMGWKGILKNVFFLAWIPRFSSTICWKYFTVLAKLPRKF